MERQFNDVDVDKFFDVAIAIESSTKNRLFRTEVVPVPAY